MGRRTKLPGVEQIGPGLYRVRATYEHPKTGMRREIDRQIEASTAALASMERERLRQEAIADRAPAQLQRRRLAQLANEWLDLRAPRLKRSTRAIYATAVDAWTDALGPYYVDAIEPRDVHEAMQRWLAAGLAPDTVNGRLRVLRTICRESRAWAAVEGVSIVSKPVPDEVDGDEDERRGLRLEELRRFLRVVEKASTAPRKGKASHLPAVGTWWAPLLLALAYTGMRFGEASALRWSDIDLELAVIRIRRAQYRGTVGETKTRAGIRNVAIPADLVRILRAHRARLLRAQGAPARSPLAFPSQAGGYAEQRRVWETAIRFYELAGIEIGDRPAIHCLRHAWNNALRQVAQPLVRQSLVGHADEGSGEAYSVAEREEKSRAVAAVVRLIRRAKGSG